MHDIVIKSLAITLLLSTILSIPAGSQMPCKELEGETVDTNKAYYNGWELSLPADELGSTGSMYKHMTSGTGALIDFDYVITFSQREDDTYMVTGAWIEYNNGTTAPCGRYPDVLSRVRTEVLPSINLIVPYAPLYDTLVILVAVAVSAIAAVFIVHRMRRMGKK